MTKIAVLAKLVPDLVEELEIAPNGKALDMMWLRLLINEFDNHAIEQAILLKERGEGEVTIVSPDAEGVEDMLFTAAAKGADRLIKLTGVDEEEMLSNHALAAVFANLAKDIQPDLVLTGVQANNDLDGAVGPLVAEHLDMPYVGYVSGVTLEDDKVVATKEYPGGLLAEVEVDLPAVLGIQASEEPPRYVAISKVRQMMKSATIEDHEISKLDTGGELPVKRMYLPEAAERAEMIEGDEDEIAAKLVEIFREIGVV